MSLYSYASALSIEEIEKEFYNVEEIQKEFYNKVVLKPIYSKYYNEYLNYICSNYDKECRSLNLNNLIDDKKTLRDTNIQNSIEKRETKFALDEIYWEKALVHLNEIQNKLFSSQFLTLIDLSNQVLILILWDHQNKIFYPIGYDFISSGNIEKEIQVINGDDHYLKTPSGIFSIQSGWRSKGEVLDDNITMPYGNKDRFVFYFGKQESVRYNTIDENGTKIEDKSKWKLIKGELEFAIHAHRSSVSLGEPHSHGCIRMSNELNEFLDNYLVFFKYFYNKNNEWLLQYAKPPSEPKYYDLAGEYMLIIDKL